MTSMAGVYIAMEPPTRYIDGNSPVITVNMKPQLLFMAALVVCATALSTTNKDEGPVVLSMGDLMMNVKVLEEMFAHINLEWILDNNNTTKVDENVSAYQETMNLQDKTYSDLQFGIFASDGGDQPIVLLKFEKTGFIASCADQLTTMVNIQDSELTPGKIC